MTRVVRTGAGPVERDPEHESWRQVALEELLPLLGLAGFGYSLPILDLLGTNPEFLVAHRLTGGALVGAALAIATIPPLLAVASVAGASALSRRAGRIVWSGWVLLFGAMATGSVLRHAHLPSDTLELLIAIAGGAALLAALRRWRAVDLACSLLSVSPLIAVVSLVAWSPASELVWQRGTGAVSGVTVAHPAPVVVLQLDELPLASLLRPDGTINDKRFPNFARLARSSTWFQNAVAIAPNTTASVPAAVTGTVPKAGDLPTAADHPDNLFTILGSDYHLQVDEPVTALCPTTLCPRSVDWGGIADDALGVAGQLWLPAGLRTRLPSELQADVANVDALGGDSALVREERAEDHIDAIHGGGDQPLLWYAHVVLPHVPWALTHSGAEYRTNAALANGPTEEGDWGDDPVLARVGFQRHLLQVGAADELVGRLIDRVQDQGLWDDAVVVVLADHGAAFDPAQHYREPSTDTAHEIYRIPFFLKLPGQTSAEARTDLVYNLDLLPTILEELGVDNRWEMNGRSVLAPVADRGPDAALYVADQHGAIHLDISFDQVTAVARRDAALLPRGDGWHAVAAGGPLGADVGRPVSQLDTSATTALRFHLERAADLTAVDTEATRALPAFVWGTMAGQGAPGDVLVVLNGTVAGTLSRFAGEDTYAGVLDESLIHQGHNTVQVLAPIGDTGGTGNRFATVLRANP